jgi:anaerobic carbon-monoxide dehydrogenase iron sulfur subunit
VRGTIFVNVDRCVACSRCQLECAVAHLQSKEFLAAMSEKPAPRPRVSLHPLGEYSVPVQCRHCENAQCIAVCPTGAMHRLGKEGPVLIDEKLCVGCRSCQIVCHFGVPKVAENGNKIYKCDQCIDRLDKEQLPACVSACHTGALTFKSIEEFKKSMTGPSWRRVPTMTGGKEA